MDILMLTSLLLLLTLGFISFVISKTLKIPAMLVLLLSGIFIGCVSYEDRPLISLPNILVFCIVIFALLIIVFDSFAKVKVKEGDTVSGRAVKLSLIFLLLNIVFLSLSAYALFDMGNFWYAVVFAVAVSGTGIAVVLPYFKERQSRIKSLLSHESKISVPIMLLLFFIILAFMHYIDGGKTLLEGISAKQFFLTVRHILVGTGIGLIAGIILFNIMKKHYLRIVSPLIIIAACIIAYVLSEYLTGSGAVSIIVLGIIYGHTYIKEKKAIIDFFDVITNSVIIAVMLIVGLVIEVPYSISFFASTIALFIIMVLIRLAAVYIAFARKEYSAREKAFIALSAPRGIAAAVIALFLLNYTVAQGQLFASIGDGVIVIQLIFAVVLYSLILSTLMMFYSEYFLNKED